MKLHDLQDGKDLQAVSNRMWEIVQQHWPELKQVMDEVVADPRLDRDNIMEAGFVFGSSFALSEMLRGNIREIHNG